MRADIDYCYENSKKAISEGNTAEATRSLELLYWEAKRLQGVIESFVEDQKRKERKGKA